MQQKIVVSRYSHIKTSPSMSTFVQYRDVSPYNYDGLAM